MLQRDDVDGRVEQIGRERERRQIGDGIQAAIIPGRIADCEIHAAVSLGAEQAGVLPFPGAGIEHARARGKRSREVRHAILNRTFEMQHVA